MKRDFFLTIVSFFLLSIYEGFSQAGCVPLPPVLKSVSIQPETGIIDFKWDPSPSDNIAAYILYTYESGIGAFPLDTIRDPSARSFSVTSGATKYKSISFVLAAHRSKGCTSPLSNALSTIFCKPELDTCKNKILLSWNKYTDSPGVKEYRILVSENGSPFSGKNTVPRDSNNFLITGFSTDVNYCFAIMAIFEDGSYSSSDKNCLLTKMQRPPDWINADYATINDRNRISLSFTFDHLSEISDFIFEKKTGDSGSFEIAGNYSSTTGNITFTDESADITRVNYYRLSAINGCKVPVTFSNIISNILPVITQAQDELSLVWNSPDRQAVFSYQGFINTGDGYGPFSSVLSDTVFSIRLKDIIYNVSGKDICFYIKASGLNNIHGINSDLKSSEVCVIPAETVTVPNVFTPDNDLVNDYFRPVLSFTPKDYYLMISDRNGRILFETHDYREEWNGEERGKIMPRDVYLWYLRVTAPSGRKITQTGTITIISTQ